MEIRQESLEQSGRQPWQGPRFEIDDAASGMRLGGIRRMLSLLTLVTLFVVGGVGFLHKVLPQMIEKEVAKQANGKKKAPPAADAVEAPNADEAARGEKQHADEEEASDVERAEFDEPWGEIGQNQAEQLQWHLDFVERHRRRHEDEVDRRYEIFYDLDVWRMGPPDKSPPKVQIKPLSN